MASIRQLYVNLTLRAESYNNAMRGARRETQEFQRQIAPTVKTVQDLGKAVQTAGIAMTAAVTAPILAVAGLGVQFNAMQEQAQIAFTTMLGDGKKARDFLEDMKNFAAKTPFEFPDLVRASQRLLAMGFSAKEIKPLLISVGDAAAGLGGGADVINRITLALGQMAGRGRVATQEMNQLTEVGIPAWRILAQGMGITEQKLRDMVEKGLVPATRSIQILQQGMDKAFGGMMAKQAETFSGLLSTIKDEARFIAGDLTTGLFNIVKGPLKMAADELERIRSAISGLSDSTKSLIAIAAAGLAAIGPLLIGVSITIAAIRTTIEGIIAARTLLFATMEVLVGAGAIRSLADARIALGLYAESLWAVRAAIIAAAVEIAVFVAAAYTIWELGNAYADSVQATQDLARANKDLEASTKVLDERLRAQGVTVDRGIKSLQMYNEELRKAGQAKWQNPLAGVIKQQIAAVEADIVQRQKQREDAAAAAAKEMERLIDSFQKSIRPADELNEKLRMLHEKFSQKDLMAVYGADALKLTLIQEGHGKAVHGLVLELANLQLQIESLNALKGGDAEMRAGLEGSLAGILSNAEKRLAAGPGNLKVGPVIDIDFLSKAQLYLFDTETALSSLGDTMDIVSKKAPFVLPPVFTQMTDKARTAIVAANVQARELGKSINELHGLGYNAAQIMAMLSGELETAAKNEYEFGTQVSEKTEYLIRQMDATKRAAEEAKRWEQTWSQVLANITTDFARGMADVIFRAKSLVGALADIGRTAGRAFIEAFMAQLFNPLTQLLAGWGKTLATTLSGSLSKALPAIGLGALVPKVAAAAAPAAVPGAGGIAAGTVGGGGASASIAAFATNPITIGVAAAIGVGLIAKHYIGQGRRAADDFGGQVERPFATQLSSLIDQFNSSRAAGSLTRDDAVSTREQLAALIRTYNAQASEFAALGKSQAKVVEQANATHAAGFGPGFTRVFDDINQTINQLTKAGTGAGLPQTGLALSASTRFADATDKFVVAVEKLAAGGVPRGKEINATFAPVITVTVGGTDPALDVRRGVIPEITSILRTGLDGVREEWTQMFGEADGVVTE